MILPALRDREFPTSQQHLGMVAQHFQSLSFCLDKEQWEEWAAGLEQME